MSQQPGSARVLVVAGLAALLASLDSALNIAFPAVTAHFDLDVATIGWLVISYVLSFAVALPVAGHVADRVGHLHLLVRGLLVSTGAFVAAGSATSYPALLGARVFQGVGAAMVLGAAPALVTLASAKARRGRALGLFQMSAAIGLAAGPLLGGLLVEAFGWRAVFLFRVPVALVIVAISWSARPSSAPHTPSLESGAALAAPGALGEIMRRPRFVIANLLHLVSHASAFAIWLLLPYYVINVIGIGAVYGGLLLMVAPFAAAVSAPPAGWLADRFGAGSLSSVGLGLEVVALGMLSRLDAESNIVLSAAALVLVGISMSVFGVPNMRYVMGSIGTGHQGVAGSTVQAMRMLGIVIGVFVASAWFEARRSDAALRLGVDPDGPASFVPAFRSTLAVAAGVAAIALAVSLLQARSERSVTQLVI